MIALLLGLFLDGSVCAATPPTGVLRPMQVQDLLLVKRTPRWYNEVWSWQFLFDNGTQATLNYTWARLGFKDPVCGADLAYAGFEGRNYSVGREYPQDRFKQSASPFRIQIHPEMSAQGLPPESHHVHFETTKNQGFYLDMEFSRMVPGVVWGNGIWKVGDDNLTIVLAIPSARVKGRIAVGKDTLQVEGWAVMEHVSQTALLADIFNSSIRAFAAGPEPSYLNLFRENDGGDWTGFGVEWSPSGPHLVAPGRVFVQDGGNLPPLAFSITSPDGRRLAFRRSTVAQSGSLLDGMEGMTRWVIKQFVGNVVLQRGLLDKPNSFYQATSVR
jgi:hypothetical protein